MIVYLVDFEHCSTKWWKYTFAEDRNNTVTNCISCTSYDSCESCRNECLYGHTIMCEKIDHMSPIIKEKLILNPFDYNKNWFDICVFMSKHDIKLLIDVDDYDQYYVVDIIDGVDSLRDFIMDPDTGY